MHLAETSPNTPIIIYIWLGLLLLAGFLTQLAWRGHIAAKRRQAQRRQESSQWTRRRGRVAAKRSEEHHVRTGGLGMDEDWRLTCEPIETVTVFRFFFELEDAESGRTITAEVSYPQYAKRAEGDLVDYSSGRYSDESPDEPETVILFPAASC